MRLDLVFWVGLVLFVLMGGQALALTDEQKGEIESEFLYGLNIPVAETSVTFSKDLLSDVVVVKVLPSLGGCTPNWTATAESGSYECDPESPAVVLNSISQAVIAKYLELVPKYGNFELQIFFWSPEMYSRVKYFGTSVSLPKEAQQ